MNTTNLTHVINNPKCEFGIGCMLRNINEVGNGYPAFSMIVVVFVIGFFGLKKAGNDTLKSFAASSTIMTIITLIGYIYSAANNEPFFKVSWFITFLIFTASSGAFLKYRDR